MIAFVKRHARESRVGFGAVASQRWRSRSGSSACREPGKTTLFTRADASRRAASTGRRTSAMAEIADPRLDGARRGRLGEEGDARRDPRAGRSRHRARRCSATCARSTRCSSCSTASRRAPTRPATSRTCRLELLVADRDHVAGRLERVEKQAKSGDPKLRAEVERLREVLARGRRRARRSRRSRASCPRGSSR